MTEPAALVAAFERIATRMVDMPLCNAALRVEAVAFVPVAAGQLGVLVTPWCINLVLLPAPGTLTPTIGRTGEYVFGSGCYEFMGAAEPECGAFQFCSMFSPPEQFVSQEQAREVAQAIMQQLLAPPPGVSRRALFVAGAAPAG